jgi:Spy/CpxP family protein refolding chaperone
MRGVMMFALMLAAAVALAQPEPHPGGPPDARFERLEQLRKVRMIDELGLKEEQSVRFFARLSEFDKRRRDLMHERHEMLNKLEQMIKENADEKELEKMFPVLVSNDQRMGEEKAKFFASLSDVLSVQQRAKLLTFERAFEKELREAVRDTQRRRMRTEE